MFSFGLIFVILETINSASIFHSADKRVGLMRSLKEKKIYKLFFTKIMSNIYRWHSWRFKIRVMSVLLTFKLYHFEGLYNDIQIASRYFGKHQIIENDHPSSQSIAMIVERFFNARSLHDAFF